MDEDIVESHIRLLGKLFPVINCDPKKIKARPKTPDMVKQLHQLDIEQMKDKDETDTEKLTNKEVKLMAATAADAKDQANSTSEAVNQFCDGDQHDQKQTDSFLTGFASAADQSFVADTEASLSGTASNFVPVLAESVQDAEDFSDQLQQNEIVEKQLNQQEKLAGTEQTDADTSNHAPTEPTSQLVSDQDHGDEVSTDMLPYAEAVQGHHQSISSELDIISYAKSEWRGNTYKAKLMCEGYHELSKQLECRSLRRVRGDNYCALRSVAYHILERASTLNLFRSATFSPSDHVQGVVSRLVDELNCAELLHQWNFANRIPCLASDRLAMAQRCADSLAKQLSWFSDPESNREKKTADLFNSADSDEVYLFEAMKLLMLECAVRSHNKYKQEEEVPTYVWLLFARDSSENPTKLLLNHLNVAGDSGGLEQIEMFLLGHALEVTIRVARPLNIHQEDFITFYPDHAADSWDQIDLIAEDDRHYNIAIR